MLQTDRRTDGQTDGAGYIGPAEGYGGSKKLMSQSQDIEFEDKNNLRTGPKRIQFGPEFGEKLIWRQIKNGPNLNQIIFWA